MRGDDRVVRGTPGFHRKDTLRTVQGLARSDPYAASPTSSPASGRASAGQNSASAALIAARRSGLVR